MIRLLTAVLLFASGVLVAQTWVTEVPNTIADGEVASAEKVMENFEALAEAISDNTFNLQALAFLDQWPSAACSDNDVIKWSASDGRYKCTQPQQKLADCSINNMPGDPFCIAFCPAGSTVISGGCEFEIFDGSSTNPSFTESRPWFNQSTGVMEGWYCGTNGVAYTDKAYAICQ